MKPLVLLSSSSMQSLTFCWKDQSRFWVGYRVCEGLPETSNHPVSEAFAGPTAEWGPFPELPSDPLVLPVSSLPRKRWRTAYQEQKRQDSLQFSFQAFADGSAWCGFREGNGQQRRELFFQPGEDGVRMWMKLTTQIPIEGPYRVQQCLRFTGAQNWSLRRKIARVPFLSELDVQAMGHPELTLTYARQGGQWLGFPARQVAYLTSMGNSPDGRKMDGTIDHGLILRETLDRRVVPASYFSHTAPGETWERLAAGMYWERTAWVSNRHPADCVHAGVDLGPLKAGETRTVHGKFYWIEGTKDDLLSAWQKDFAPNL